MQAHFDFQRLHGTCQGRPRHLAGPRIRVSVPNPEQTAWHRDGKNKRLPSISSLQSMLPPQRCGGKVEMIPGSFGVVPT